MGLLRLFEIPAPPPTESKRKRRGAAERKVPWKPQDWIVHVPFKQKFAAVISAFTKELQESSTMYEIHINLVHVAQEVHCLLISND